MQRTKGRGVAECSGPMPDEPENQTFLHRARRIREQLWKAISTMESLDAVCFGCASNEGEDKSVGNSLASILDDCEKFAGLVSVLLGDFATRIGTVE